MFKPLILVTPLFLLGTAHVAGGREPEPRAYDVTITRDDWGIAHVRGKTDADAVFGAIYAQAEDDFNRIEVNYLNAMGRLAEAEGESAIYRDLRMKLFIHPDTLKKLYSESPAWLKSLMVAFADGLNRYLATHPEVKPRVINHFEPWMALSFSEGSIGGDIERVNLVQLQLFYGSPTNGPPPTDEFLPTSEPKGSNGMAIAPANTVRGRPLLLINPHTSFYFRSELQMTSDEGLNAYGASTWGQFFIYQGFNQHAGWMHTSSGVDAIDEYLETVTKRGERWFAKYGNGERPVTASQVVVPYKTATGMAEKRFTVFHTAHGPVVRSVDGKWVAVAMMNDPLTALTQSYMRTKSTDYASFRKTMDLHTNSSNNTIFADAKGNIAYFHANYIQRRDPKFDWTKPVDGSDPATDYKGLLGVAEIPNLLNPASGWLYNSNNWPWTSAGASSPKRADFPAYVDMNGETMRGLHAIRVLENVKDFTIDKLIAAAYDSYQMWFEKPMPALLKAWDALPAAHALKARLPEQIAVLRAWDLRASVSSVPTLLAIFWGQEVQRTLATPARDAGKTVDEFIVSGATPEQLVSALAAASNRLVADFGTWKTPWGDYNRFQRLTDDIVHPFSDAAPSIPVGFTSGTPWGSLASFAAAPYRGSKKIYGTSGNSFVAVVEFGADSVRARAITAGGESGDVKSPHFNDQAKRYSTGDLREVYFYPNQLKAHTERVYRPGN